MRSWFTYEKLLLYRTVKQICAAASSSVSSLAFQVLVVVAMAALAFLVGSNFNVENQKLGIASFAVAGTASLLFQFIFHYARAPWKLHMEMIERVPGFGGDPDWPTLNIAAAKFYEDASFEVRNQLDLDVAVDSSIARDDAHMAAIEALVWAGSVGKCILRGRKEMRLPLEEISFIELAGSRPNSEDELADKDYGQVFRVDVRVKADTIASALAAYAEERVWK